ncbi:TraR conjugal transfer protein [Candidatus Williamhamiltonella defendens]|uniref:TraR conjugal transfer protein n=1 Tax=Candidatus Williamhamiltonella defendens TaxID=138072 RepID=A0AAC9YFR5_9ENTR|nr:DUF6750 family protein [Candidatus Hamiltonella defensa]ASV33926.1 TraR conjugal transfer protein [Candidatus Hamiltonella defensa]AWK16881.1 TraR conjugal transfer protein [Candidatus Hamiltonella defensa]
MHPCHDPILFFYVHLSLWADRLRQKTGQVLIALLSLCVTQTASADEDIAGMVNHITQGIASVKPGLMMAAQVAGVGCVIAGIFLWLRKKNDPHIKGSSIAIFIGIGCILIALDQFISRGQKQAGLRPVSLS